jgi:SP family facilitated glucose transporter-like MFS transporter 8
MILLGKNMAQIFLKCNVVLQIFPVNIKGQAGSIATLVNWFGAWLCSYTFNFLMSWSSYGKYIIFQINSI